MTPTNDTAHRLSERCQQLRIRTGELDPAGPQIDTGRWRFHVGDEIATRLNDRQLRTDRGDMIRNRTTWTITNPSGGTPAFAPHADPLDHRAE